ncbi:MAG: 2-C-methyl-D-erythritol 2,4-cyclodiphosphate synthase [Candidatus Moranbacteria bacterium]|nr:2-C-methyl-D-erythritol 2,4-cyclodiphosphate synthase [Candidatus Moranbacteria bacterium]
MFRVGFGQDSHQFSKDENKKLILGGVEVRGYRGLESNSDGDPISHALCAAIEQALGRTNFSVYADEMCKKGIIDSLEYLRVAKNHIEEAGYALNNLGISVEGKVPRILPIEGEIKDSLAEVLSIEKNKIGINATTGEELTAFGRGEGIQVFAIVSLVLKSELANKKNEKI